MVLATGSDSADLGAQLMHQAMVLVHGRQLLKPCREGGLAEHLLPRHERRRVHLSMQEKFTGLLLPPDEGV